MHTLYKEQCFLKCCWFGVSPPVPVLGPDYCCSHSASSILQWRSRSVRNICIFKDNILCFLHLWCRNMSKEHQKAVENNDDKTNDLMNLISHLANLQKSYIVTNYFSEYMYCVCFSFCPLKFLLRWRKNVLPSLLSQWDLSWLCKLFILPCLYKILFGGHLQCVYNSIFHS